jgi:putative ABC transport system permease protein
MLHRSGRVRLASAAPRGDIIKQFLIETTVMSGSDSLIGVVLDLAVRPVIARLSGIPVFISPWSQIVAFLIALLTGVRFGVYPARRAALLDPVEALQSE